MYGLPRDAIMFYRTTEGVPPKTVEGRLKVIKIYIKPCVILIVLLVAFYQ